MHPSTTRLNGDGARARRLVATILGMAILGWVGMAHAQVPAQLHHEGRLLDESGEPAAGPHTMTLTLYNSETGGSVLWETRKSVEVGESGYYEVTLGGSDNPLDESVLEGGDVWLGVSVDGGAEMQPRQHLDSVAYAVIASRAENVAEGSITEENFSEEIEISGDAIENLNWGMIDAKPPDLVDGDDDTLGRLSCADGEIPEYDGSEWTCGTDETSTVNDLGGAPLSCSEGQVAKRGPDGWTCAPDGMPSGAVMMFNREDCPPGWSELTAAGGRALVGMPSGGTVGATVGSAMSDQETRQHSHNVDPPQTSTSSNGNHKHLSPVTSAGGHGGSGMRIADSNDPPWGTGTGPNTNTKRDEVNNTDNNNSFFRTSSNGNHSHSVDVGQTSSSSANHTMPYLQLLVCQRE